MPSVAKHSISFEHKQGVVQKIDESSKQLADGLKNGVPVVITILFDKKLEQLGLNRMDRNSTQAVKFLDRPDVPEFVTQLLRNQVYDRIQSEEARAAGQRG